MARTVSFASEPINSVVEEQWEVLSLEKDECKQKGEMRKRVRELTCILDETYRIDQPCQNHCEQAAYVRRVQTGVAVERVEEHNCAEKPVYLRRRGEPHPQHLHPVNERVRQKAIGVRQHVRRKLHHLILKCLLSLIVRDAGEVVAEVDDNVVQIAGNEAKHRDEQNNTRRILLRHPPNLRPVKQPAKQQADEEGEHPRNPRRCH